MRTKTVIFILLSAFMFMMAEPGMPFFERGSGGSGANDSTVVVDSSAVDTVAAADSLHADSVSTTSEVDTTKMDSLELAIYKHNKHIDDSIRLDSINRKKESTGLGLAISEAIASGCSLRLTYSWEEGMHVFSLVK